MRPVLRGRNSKRGVSPLASPGLASPGLACRRADQRKILCALTVQGEQTTDSEGGKEEKGSFLSVSPYIATFLDCLELAQLLWSEWTALIFDRG